MNEIDSKKILQVFVSSTYEDLIPYRDAVNKALVRMGVIVKGMEFFGSKPGRPKEECLEVVRECDIYIGVFAMKYGSVDRETGKSMTHLEYDEAQKIGLPSFIYLIDENNQPVIPKSVDTGENAEKLCKLKEVLKTAHIVSFFTTPDSLSRGVTEDLKPRTTGIKVEIKKEEKKVRKVGVINPLVFNMLGKKEIYMLYKLRNYHVHRKDLTDVKFGCYGIFGIADLCVKGIDVGVEEIKENLSDIFTDVDSTSITSSDYFSVGKFIKYNGFATSKLGEDGCIELWDQKSEGAYSIDYSIIDKYRNEIKKLAIDWNDGTVNESIKEILEGERIIIGTYKYSVDDDDAQRQSWILGVFLPRESGVGLQSCESFERNIIEPFLIGDPRIRTIVYSGYNASGVSLHYIIEIVASANEIWNDIVLKIHENCGVNRLIVNTKTSLIVDYLSDLKYDTILEPELQAYQMIERRELLRFFNKGMTKIELDRLNLIQLLKQSQAKKQQKIINVHKKISQFMTDFQHFSKYKEDLVRFLVGMILCDKLENKEVSDRYYSYFYQKIAGTIEHELRIILKEKISTYSKEKSDDYPNLLKSLKIKTENLDIIALGDCIRGIINWNAKFPNDPIISVEFNNSLKELQRHLVPNVRNMFVHCDYTDKNEKYAAPEIVESSLNATINFITENPTLFSIS